ASVLLSILSPRALALLLATYAYSASVLAVPLIGGMILAKRGQIPVLVSYVSMAAGLIGCSIAHALGTTVPYATYGIAASLGVFVIAYLAVKKNIKPNTPSAQPAATEHETVSELD